MGYFGQLAYSDGRWNAGRPTAVPFLLVDVHDSDLATIDYRSADATGGRFFLRYEPRFYFAEADAGLPVDTAAEAQGFTDWVRGVTGRELDPADVRPLLADPDGAPPSDEVVELTVDRLVELAGLPTVEWPTDTDSPAG